MTYNIIAYVSYLNQTVRKRLVLSLVHAIILLYVIVCQDVHTANAMTECLFTYAATVLYIKLQRDLWAS